MWHDVDNSHEYNNINVTKHNLRVLKMVLEHIHVHVENHMMKSSHLLDM